MTCLRDRILSLAIGLISLIASFGFADQGNVSTSMPEAIPANVAQAMSPAQKRRAMQMTTYFENSTIQFQYSYIEDIHDGRGFTAGRIGFFFSGI